MESQPFAQQQLDALDQNRDAIAGRLLLPWRWHLGAGATVALVWAAPYLPEWWDVLASWTGLALIIWLGRVADRIRGLRLPSQPVTPRVIVSRVALVVCVLLVSAAVAYAQRRFDLPWLHPALGALAAASTVLGGRWLDRRSVRRFRADR